jgi:hypothetical protein
MGVQGELEGRPALLRDACERALAYLGGLAGRPVAPDADAVAALSRLDFALPGSGLAAPRVLALLDEAGSPATVASGGPRYFGFVTGGSLPIAQAAAWTLPVIRKRSSTRYRMKEPAGAGRPPGVAARRCGSALAAGTPPRPT